jgi:hypothetical protein
MIYTCILLLLTSIRDYVHVMWVMCTMQGSQMLHCRSSYMYSVFCGQFSVVGTCTYTFNILHIQLFVFACHISGCTSAHYVHVHTATWYTCTLPYVCAELHSSAGLLLTSLHCLGILSSVQTISHIPLPLYLNSSPTSPPLYLDPRYMYYFLHQ